jgi:nucleotide-binding universal stress UspA family protein
VFSILLALDGSAEGDKAIGLAVNWAARFGASVTAIGIVDEHAIAAPEPASIGGDAFKERRDRNLLTLAHDRVDAALEAFSARARPAGIRFQALKRVTDRHSELTAATQAHDILIMPRDTHFTGPDDEESDGTLESLLGECSRPIVAVPADVQDGAGTLIAYSGGTRSARALQDMVATRIHQLGPNWIVSVDRHSAEAAREKAERALEFLRTHESSAELLPIVSHQPLDDILVDQAIRLKVALLAMGTHSRSRIVSYFTGSTLHGVLSRAMFPVFLAP